MKRPPYNVDPRAFVSYIREDSARVDILSNELRSRDIGVLRDTTHIEVATDWRHRIANMIQDAHAFVLCCSQGAIDKNDTYMREEIRQAVERSRTLRPDVKWIIPIRLDGCNVSTLLRAHDLNISSLTWIDWLDNNDTRAIDAVANAIREAHQGHREQGR